MAIEKVTVIKVDTGAAQTSVKDLRNELKMMKDAMLSAEEGTDEYNDALTRAAEIQHTLKEQMELVNASAMDFGQIAQNTTKLVGGMVAGIQAAKATMNLFGVENEDVIKSLEKMQNLMAITQALPSLDAGFKAFKRLSSAISTATGATSKFGKALISTGLGALVVALGLLITNFDSISGWLDKITGQTDFLGTLWDKVVSGLLAGLQNTVGALKLVGNAIVKYVTAPFRTVMNAINAYMGTNGSFADKIKAAGSAMVGTFKDDFEEIKDQALQLGADVSDAYQKGLESRSKSRKDVVVKTAAEQLKDFQDGLKREQDAEKVMLAMRVQSYKKFQEEIAKIDYENEKRWLDYNKRMLEEGKKNGTLTNSDIATLNSNIWQSTQKVLKYEEDMLQASLQNVNTYVADRNKKTDDGEKELLAALRKDYDERKQYIEDLYNHEAIAIASADTSHHKFLVKREELEILYTQRQLLMLRKFLEENENITDDMRISVESEMVRLANSLRSQERAKFLADVSEQLDEVATMFQNASSALNEFCDNPAWGNIMNQIAGLASNWQTLNAQIEEGGKKAIGAYLSIASTGFAMMGQMLNGLADEQDATNREGFESQKNLQAAGASMNMFAGIVSAWASAMQLGPIVGPILGAALSAMMLGLGIANIAKIKSQQFDDGSKSAGGSAAGTPNTSAISSIIAPVQYTKDVQGAEIEGSIKNSRVYVTETDISDTQNRVRVTENEARY